MILRTLANKRLILQSWGGGHGLIGFLIDANNYVYFNELLSSTIDNVERSVVENFVLLVEEY